MLSKIHFYFFIFKLWAWYCLSIYISSSVNYLLRFIFIFEEQFIFYLLPVGFFTNDKWYFSCLTIARFKIFWRFQITCLHMALVRGSKAPPLTPSFCPYPNKVASIMLATLFGLLAFNLFHTSCKIR